MTSRWLPVGLLTLLVGCKCVACSPETDASDPSAIGVGKGKDGGASDDGGPPPEPYDFPACTAASGPAAPGGAELTDDTGKATVETRGTGCERTFVLASTAARKDNF